MQIGIGLAITGLRQGLWAPGATPVVASPNTATLYVSGTSPSILAAGSDTTGDGTFAKPYATLTKALTVVPVSGDYLILCDGTFTENSGASGRWILAGVFSAPVLIKSYTADATKFIISNTSGTAGVMNVRSSPVSNVQVQYATLRTTTDLCPTIEHNPTSSANKGSNIGLFDCVLETKTGSSIIPTLSLVGDQGVTNLNFVRCSFKATTGGSTTNKPVMIAATSLTQSTTNTPHQNVGFYDCTTTDSGWLGFSNGVTGLNGMTVVRNVLSTQTYGCLIGTDTSGTANQPRVLNAYIDGNTLSAAAPAGHALLIGDGVINATAQNNTVTGAFQGIVTKGSTNALVRFNTVTVLAGGLNGLYAKASAGTNFFNNTVTVDGSTSAAAAFREGNDSANKASGTRLNNNTLTASGASATLLQWGDSTASTGGASADYNAYHTSSGAAFGAVRGTTVASLAATRTAWGSSGLTGDNAANDANSTTF